MRVTVAAHQIIQRELAIPVTVEHVREEDLVPRDGAVAINIEELLLAGRHAPVLVQVNQLALLDLAILIDIQHG
jgi:hypothetical protein